MDLLLLVLTGMALLNRYIRSGNILGSLEKIQINNPLMNGIADNNSGSFNVNVVLPFR